MDYIKSKGTKLKLAYFIIIILIINVLANTYFAYEIRNSNVYDLDPKAGDVLENSDSNLDVNVNSITSSKSSRTSSIDDDQNFNLYKNDQKNNLTAFISFGSSSFIVLCIVFLLIIVNVGLHMMHTK